jgi:hypothetical protein
MRAIRPALAIALCAAASAFGQDPAAASRPDFAAEWKTLNAEYRAALQTWQKPVAEAIKNAKGGMPTVTLDDATHPRHAFRERMYAFFARAKDAPEGVDAAIWAIRNCRTGAGKIEPQIESYAKLLDETVARYGATPDAIRIAKTLGGSDWITPGGPAEVIRKMVPLATEPAASRGLRHTLARCLLARPGGADDVARKEAIELLRVLAADADASPNLAKAVKEDLFEFEHLSVGCVAPDFEATDAEGVKFKLSDYRGKVLVLDFWGFW